VKQINNYKVLLYITYMSKEELKILSMELHKPAKKKFETRKVVVYGADEIYSADLMDFQEWSKENDGNKYALCIIDVFTKYATVTPIKDKTGKTIMNAFKEACDKKFKSYCKLLWVDKGTEFYNNEFIKFGKQHGFQLYSTYSENKAVVVERFNKTMKDKIWMYFTANQTRNWIDEIEKIVTKYNNTKHRTIGTTPNKARENTEAVLEYVAKHQQKTKDNRQSFKVGDKVRISRVKGTFEKGYLPNWSMAVYTVDEVLNTNPVTYKLKEYDGEVLEGSFYNEELQKTKIPELYLVEKILKTRKNKQGKKEYLIKWLGWDTKFNSWIGENDFTDITGVKPEDFKN
jgi:hypothetical protein